MAAANRRRRKLLPAGPGSANAPTFRHVGRWGRPQLAVVWLGGRRVDDEVRLAEERRLLKQTAALEQRTASLALDRTPFDAADHAQLRADIVEHRRQLADYRRRIP